MADATSRAAPGTEGADLDKVRRRSSTFITARPGELLRLAASRFEIVAADGAKSICCASKSTRLPMVGSLTPHLGAAPSATIVPPACSHRRRLRFVYFDGEKLAATFTDVCARRRTGSNRPPDFGVPGQAKSTPPSAEFDHGLSWRIAPEPCHSGRACADPWAQYAVGLSRGCKLVRRARQ